METYRAILSTETNPEAPGTSALFKALAANPIAIAQGAFGAPKIAQKSVLSGTEAQTQTFTGLGAFEGVEFDFLHATTTTTATNFQFQFSTDGGTSWSTAFTMFSTSSVGKWRMSGAFDFATGTFIGVVSNAESLANIRVSSTLAGASLAIDAIRFTSSQLNHWSVGIIRPKGATT